MADYSLNGSNVLPAHDTLVKNILSVWNEATEAEIALGRDWYPAANDWAKGRSEAFEVPILTVASVISATSPGCRWDRNLLAAHRILAAFSEGEDDEGIVEAGIVPGRCPGVNARRAVAILRGTDHLRGPKTRAFALAIAGDTDSVVVDVHAIRVATNAITGRVFGVTAPAYPRIAAAYAHAAVSLGELPTAMQAVTWTVCVNRRKGK